MRYSAVAAHVQKTQIVTMEDLSGMTFLNCLDGGIRVMVTLHPALSRPNSTELIAHIYHQAEPIGTLSFGLHEFSPVECRAIAQDISRSPYIMQQIDDFLCADYME